MLETVRLLCDAGLLVLVWMVQLIAYPSFSYFNSENLYKWHETYTVRISIIVIPLMFGQLATTAIQVFQEQNFYTITSSSIVILLWCATLIVFVPLHAAIASKRNVEESVKKLESKNWLRTILWTLLFIMTLYVEFTTL